MHIMGVVLSVPEANKDAYCKMAEDMAAIFIDYGAIEVIESWEESVPDGENTDFRKAVKAEAGEKIVFSWAIFPDKATSDKAHEDMMQDERMQKMPPEMPFDGKRMIMGEFSSIVAAGR